MRAKRDTRDRSAGESQLRGPPRGGSDAATRSRSSCREWPGEREAAVETGVEGAEVDVAEVLHEKEDEGAVEAAKPRDGEDGSHVRSDGGLPRELLLCEFELYVLDVVEVRLPEREERVGGVVLALVEALADAVVEQVGVEELRGEGDDAVGVHTEGVLVQERGPARHLHEGSSAWGQR